MKQLFFSDLVAGAVVIFACLSTGKGQRSSGVSGSIEIAAQMGSGNLGGTWI
ncbi:hypothetical protein [Corynebacterium lubricantis]|uniref:hypothetical protein n=1 Tax=Corynebacterium lubricantis TaxID=541095 RepID=UPI0012E9DE94|nr:hypothetical protein [Corynebacterium lubricantis]